MDQKVEGPPMNQIKIGTLGAGPEATGSLELNHTSLSDPSIQLD